MTTISYSAEVLPASQTAALLHVKTHMLAISHHLGKMEEPKARAQNQ